jgi:hypothetical protein
MDKTKVREIEKKTLKWLWAAVKEAAVLYLRSKFGNA